MAFERLGGEKKRYTEIISVIKARLIKGELMPGDKLPTEVEMVDQLGVSRTPVREAMKILESIGVIQIKRGEGMFIEQNLNSSSLSPLIFGLIMHSNNISKLIEFRQHFEIMLIDLVAANCSKEDLEQLDKIFEYQCEASKKMNITDEQWADIDLEFHHAMLAATQNPFFIEIGTTVYELYRHKIAQMAREFGRDQSLRTHKLYLQALKSQDVEKRLELKRQIDSNYRKLNEK